MEAGFNLKFEPFVCFVYPSISFSFFLSNFMKENVWGPGISLRKEKGTATVSKFILLPLGAHLSGSEQVEKFLGYIFLHTVPGF